MPRANPNSLATKWVAQSDAMPNELIALEDAITAAKKARDRYLDAHPAIRARLARIRDSAPLARSNAPFSIFADRSCDPKPAA
jgi:hypothetical protein